MEAKDTVMETEEIEQLLRSNGLFVDAQAPACSSFKLIKVAQAQISFKAGEKQARWDVGEELCCLVGDLMLRDMEAGKLLGNQLSEYMKRQLKEWGGNP